MANSIIDQSMINFHGSYQQDNTFNVFLEYADESTLENYFENTAPPFNGGDIIRFWRGLFEVIQALAKIHEVGPIGSEDTLFHG